MLGDYDLILLQETFLEKDHLVQFPNDYLCFFSPASRNSNSGRAAGGLCVMVKSCMVIARETKMIHASQSVLGVHIAFGGGLILDVFCVYRSGNPQSPVFCPDFSNNLATLVGSSMDSVLVGGDFNAKIGQQDAVPEELHHLVPMLSTHPKIDQAGWDLLASMSTVDVVLAYAGQGNSNRKAQRTNRSITGEGGSVIDYFFLSGDLFENFSGVEATTEPESTHCRVTGRLACNVQRIPAKEDPRCCRKVDWEKLLDLSHPDELRDLAHDPDSMSASEAYEVLGKFLDEFTFSSDVSADHQKTKSKSGSELIKNELRRMERVGRKRHTFTNGAAREVIARWREVKDGEIQQQIYNRLRLWRAANRNRQPKRAWQLAREKLPDGNGKRRRIGAISVPEWESHFSAIYDPPGVNPITRSAPRGVTVDLLDRPFTPEEVTLVLEQKLNHKSPGPDGYKYDFWRIFRYDKTVTSALSNCFSIMLNTGELPEVWNEAYLYVLYKGKGDVSCKNNYRGITLKSHHLKLFESLLMNRFRLWMSTKDELPAEQVAYLPGRDTTDHIFTLNYLREEAIRIGRTLFICAIDFQKAFPSVDREKLLEELRELGLSDKYISVLETLYSNDTYRVMVDGEIGTKRCRCRKGVHEGSCASPSLFITFIRKLVQFLKSSDFSKDSPSLLSFGQIVLLIYADDILLLSYSQESLQELLNLTYQFCEEKHLVINEAKTDIMAMGSHRGTPRDWQVGQMCKPGVPSLRYLGIHFEDTPSWMTQIDQLGPRLTLALGRCKVIVSSLGKPALKISINFFDTIVSPIFRYALGSWGPLAPQKAKLDNFYVDFIRFLLCLPRNTCKKGTFVQTGRRCIECDALYLGALQIARGLTSGGSIWGHICKYAIVHNQSHKWFRVVCHGARVRGFDEMLFERPSTFIGERRRIAVNYDQFCFHHHLNRLTGRSADYFRINRPSGAYPFTNLLSSSQVGVILKFVLSTWKWSAEFHGMTFPTNCLQCGVPLNSPHVLFECTYSEHFRSCFRRQTAVQFDIEILKTCDKEVAREIFFVCQNVLKKVLPLFCYPTVAHRIGANAQ